MLENLDNWLGSQKDNLILWIPVFLGIGSAVYFSLLFEPIKLLSGFFWGVSLVALLLVFVHRAEIKFIWFFLILAVFLSVSGFGLAQLKTNIVHTPLLSKETRPLIAEGRVAHTEILDGRKGTLVILDDVKLENFEAKDTPKKIRLTSKLRVRFNLGERVQMLVKLTPPSMPVMPGAYDFRRHYYFDGIGAMGFILKKPVVITAPPENDMSLFLERLRKTMGEYIKALLPSRISGIVTALVTGERAAIQEEDWDALRVSGLAHIISISGLHVVLIATPIFFFVRLFLAAIPRLALRYPIKKIAAVVALIGCSLYVVLVMPAVPTYRALLMTGIGLIAIMIDRSPFSLRLVSFAAIIVLLFAPESIWSASFQLSFAAVISLILSAEWTREYWSKWRNNASHVRKFLIYLAGSIFTTLVVSIITAPLAAYHFQQIPIYSVVANALIIPLSAIIIMPMTIATFLLWPFAAQDIALKIMGYGIEWMLAIAHGISSLPEASWNIAAWPISAMVCFVFAGLSLYLLHGRTRWISAIGVAAGSVFIFFYQPPSILISQSGGLMMIRDGDKIYLSSSMKDKFFAENWVKRLGLEEGSALLFPREGQVLLSGGSITCGEGQCRIIRDGKKITFGNDYYALKTDCDWADIIVTPTAFRDRNCKARINNKFTLMDSGTVEIAEDGSVKTVAYSLGKKPWSPVSDRYGSNSRVRPESARGQL